MQLLTVTYFLITQTFFVNSGYYKCNSRKTLHNEKICKSGIKIIVYSQALYNAYFQCIGEIAGLDTDNTLESQYNIR